MPKIEIDDVEGEFDFDRRSIVDAEEELARQFDLLGLKDDTPPPIVSLGEKATIHDYRRTCRELQVQNGELRISIKKLMIDKANLTSELEASTTKQKTDHIPPAFQKYKDTIDATPNIDWKDPKVRYANPASEDKAAAAELCEFFKKQPAPIDLLSAESNSSAPRSNIRQ
ncbi:hypothetical protein BC629DRAFT_1591066 [Irpex lacteus]|nr:hypothetical protein BC629DRAFT_1591066 [Irpex lacteus]